MRVVRKAADLALQQLLRAGLLSHEVLILRQETQKCLARSTQIYTCTHISYLCRNIWDPQKPSTNKGGLVEYHNQELWTPRRQKGNGAEGAAVETITVTCVCMYI